MTLPPSAPARPRSAVRLAWRLASIAAAGAHATVAARQQSISVDGVNYLEMGAAYWRADWETAVNGIWSPLYGVITAGVLRLVEPSVWRVFPTVQLVNFLIFLCSLFAFEFFWREALRRYEDRHAGWGGTVLSPASFWSLGYALFLWSSLTLIEMWSVTPDMLVSVTVFLSAGFLLRLLSGAGAGASAGLGASLGVGYLTKAPMFPLSLVFFVIAALAARATGRPVKILAPALLAFGCVAGPMLTVLSLSQGHPTFSEVSRFTYLKHVNRIPYPRLTDEATRDFGIALHPPRLVHSSPEVFAFDGPVAGPYPPLYDPDYFTEGLSPRVSVSEQLNAVAFNLAFYFRVFLRSQGAFVGLALMFGIVSLRTYRRRELLGGEWHLTLWCVACFGMYSLVFVTGRYVAPFVVLFWAGALSYWRLPEGSSLTRRLSGTGAALMVLALLADFAALNLDGLASIAGVQRPVEAPATQFSSGPGASSPAVAEAIGGAGVRPGTDVALIGDSPTASWAYLAGVRIVADVSREEAPDFWRAPAETQEAVLEAFTASGAAYAIAEAPRGASAAGAGWRRLDAVGYWLVRLDP